MEGDDFSQVDMHDTLVEIYLWTQQDDAWKEPDELCEEKDDQGEHAIEWWRHVHQGEHGALFVEENGVDRGRPYSNL